MNRDILEGRWKQLRGRIKETWGKLTDDELDQAQGRFDRLIGLIQEKYGYTREKAKEEFNRFLELAKDRPQKRFSETQKVRR